MPQNQSEVIAGRNMLVYTATFNPTAPGNQFPVDTIVWGTSWGNASAGFPWTEKGFTRDGLRFRMNVPRTNILVDQVVDPVLRIPNSRELNMETNLAQVNTQNLQEATGQLPSQITTVAATTAARGHSELVIQGTIVDAFLTAGFDILNPGDLEAVRLIGWKGIVLAEVQMNFQVTDAAQIAFNVGLVPDTLASPARVVTFRDIIAAG